MHSRQKNAKAGSCRSSADMESEMDYIQIKKEIGFLTSSHMSWKDKKEIENRKVVSLGGKSQKKQRLPLSVARPIMKKQKEREQKMVQEHMKLYGGVSSSNNPRRKSSWKSRPEDRVLKSSEGSFKKGVLDVKHLLGRAPPRNGEFRSSDFGNELGGGGKDRKKVGKKNNKNKKKGVKTATFSSINELCSRFREVLHHNSEGRTKLNSTISFVLEVHINASECLLEIIKLYTDLPSIHRTDIGVKAELLQLYEIEKNEAAKSLLKTFIDNLVNLPQDKIQED